MASDDIPAKQPEGPKLVKGQEPETLDKAGAASEPMPLFSESEMGDFRSQWGHIQTGFVDEPRRTVEDADKLWTDSDAFPVRHSGSLMRAECMVRNLFSRHRLM